MIEPLLFGIVLGMMSVSLAGLFVAAWLQMKRTQEFY
jgi:cytochrome b6-f complex subunit 5|tara:strand:- start:17089 stop:17199 length:111 start_codon:yes stop_codon:yes gene_type:complete